MQIISDLLNFILKVAHGENLLLMEKYGKVLQKQGYLSPNTEFYTQQHKAEAFLFIQTVKFNGMEMTELMEKI